MYLPADDRANALLDSVASAWQWLNGTVAISFTDVGVDVALSGNCHLCRYYNPDRQPEERRNPCNHDRAQVATEVYRLLEEDGDCEIGQIGTRGPSNGRHEGRGSWKWKDYLGNTSLAGKTNAFWDTETNRLDFQKYCATNGFEGIDYFLIALGTNDVSQGSTLYRTEAEVQKFVDYAKRGMTLARNVTHKASPLAHCVKHGTLAGFSLFYSQNVHRCMT